MSVRVLTEVWSRSAQKSGNLLVLLAIADNANDSGYAFPGVDHLAAKARMSPRNVQRCIRQLETAGELRCDIGAGPHGCNAYYVLPRLLRPGDERVTDCHPTTPTTRKGDTHDRAGVTPTTQTGDTHATRTVKKPSLEPSKKPNPLIPLEGEEEFWIKTVFECFRQSPRPLELRLVNRFRTALPDLDRAKAASLVRLYRDEPMESKEPPFNSRKHSPERLLRHLPAQLALAASHFPPAPPRRPPPPEPAGWREALRADYPNAITLDDPQATFDSLPSDVQQTVLRRLKQHQAPPQTSAPILSAGTAT